MLLKTSLKSLAYLTLALGATFGLAPAADAANPETLLVQYPSNKYVSRTATKGTTTITGWLEAYGPTPTFAARIAGGVSTSNNYYARYDFYGEYACTNMAQRAPFPNNDYNTYGFLGSVNVTCAPGANPGGARVFLFIR